MNFKKISLVTPTHNSEKYLEKTILSVINQNYPNLEYIIIDGGSTDSTLPIIKKYENNISMWVSEKDRGMYFALKKGFNLASGEIYGWINSDDILMPNSLWAVNEFFCQHEDAQWVTGCPSAVSIDSFAYPPASHSHAYRIYKEYEYLNSPPYAIQQESTFFAANLYDKVDGVSTDYELAGDYDLWAKFFKHSDLKILDVYLGAFRYHEGQRSASKQRYLAEVRAIRKKYNNRLMRIKYGVVGPMLSVSKLFPGWLRGIVINYFRSKSYRYCKEEKIFK